MNFDEKLEKFLDKSQILKDEPMKKHTSFKIGGIADYFILINTKEQLVELLKACKEFNKQYFIIGNGTNLLVTDKGFRGIIIKLKLENIEIEENENEAIINVEAGYQLIKLAKDALDHGLEGLEFAAGIPGTVGGAIRMNAGAYGGEIKDVVVSTKYLDVEDYTIKVLNFDEHEFSYRNSIFARKPYIILETKIKLKKGNKDIIKTKMEENNKSRFSKQPIEFANAGSTFKRKEGISTAALIDESGLKGFCFGDAEVSTKHAGFLINKGNATFEDMEKLIKYVQKTIYENYNIKIELEVLVIGEK